MELHNYTDAQVIENVNKHMTSMLVSPKTINIKLAINTDLAIFFPEFINPTKNTRISHTKLICQQT